MIFKQIREKGEKYHKEYMKCKHKWELVKRRAMGGTILGLFWTFGRGERIFLVCKKCGTIQGEMEE